MSLFPWVGGGFWRCGVGCTAAVAGLGVAMAAGQAPAPSTTLVEPPAPLLPTAFGGWKTTDTGDGASRTRRLEDAGDAALKECGERRVVARDYDRGGKTLHVEAMEFGDATGAFSAMTLLLRPGMRLGKDLGRVSAVGGGEALFTSGDTVVLASPVEGTAVGELRALELTLPKIGGPRGLPPLLPTLLPAKGLDLNSERYALGPVSYQQMGGTLPTGTLGFDKAAEAATAHYPGGASGKQGTLTLLLYPTPEIAGDRGRALEQALNAGGERAGTAKLRREGPLMVLAQGFAPEAAAALVDGVHLRSEVTWNKQMVPEFHAEVRKTASLLVSIAVFSGVLGAGAILLGLFLGVGRAWIRVLLGKPAASEPEFLRLGLRSGPVARLTHDGELEQR